MNDPDIVRDVKHWPFKVRHPWSCTTCVAPSTSTFIQRSHSNSRLDLPAAPGFPSDVPFTVDYSLAPGRPARLQAHSPHPLIGQGQTVQQPPSTSSHPMDPSMITLLQTLRGTVPYRGGIYDTMLLPSILILLQMLHQHHYARPLPVHIRTGSAATGNISCARMSSLPNNRGDVLPR